MNDESHVAQIPEPSDLLALLDRVERDGGGFADNVLSFEVDNLLGHARKTSDRIPPEDAGTVADTSTRHGWYQAILAKTPDVPGTHRVLNAAMSIEAGLLATERLATNDATLDSLRGDLIELAQIGAAEYEFLVESNLRLVFHWARRIEYSIGEDLLQDAFQAGCLGLMRGIQGWDHELGYALSTYVSWHIRQTIQRWRYDETTIIRLPVHVWEKLKSDSNDLSLATRTAAESAQNVEALASIDYYAPTFAWDGGLEDVVVARDRHRLVEALLGCLSEREAAVLSLRHGLDSADTPRTLDDIGKLFGLTRERIRQIEAKATAKLQELFNSDDAAELY